MKRFAALDKDGNGVVSREEFLSSFDQQKPDSPSRHGHGGHHRGGFHGPRSASDLLKNLDKNQDGSISKSEVPERMWDRFLARFDADKNGVITKDELEKALKDRQQDKPAGDAKPATSEPSPQPKPEGDKPPAAKEESKPQAKLVEPDAPADALSVVNAA